MNLCVEAEAVGEGQSTNEISRVSRQLCRYLRPVCVRGGVTNVQWLVYFLLAIWFLEPQQSQLRPRPSGCWSEPDARACSPACWLWNEQMVSTWGGVLSRWGQEAAQVGAALSALAQRFQLGTGSRFPAPLTVLNQQPKPTCGWDQSAPAQEVPPEVVLKPAESRKASSSRCRA